MTSTISTLNPSLALDILRVVQAANRKFYPNSGQTGTLSTVAMIQMVNAAQPAGSTSWSVPLHSVVSATGLSKGTVRSHIKFWVERGVLSVDWTPMDNRYFVNLGA